ncbi:MAG: DsbE family thiol:disulfide interchange protein [Legionellales bacterium]
MSRYKMGWRLIPVGFFLLLSFFLWRGLSLDPHHLPSVQIGKNIAQFKVPQLQNPQEDFSPKNLNQQVVLLNIWASWCEACVEEQVFLMQLARDGVPIYGLNYKDKAEDALRWLEQWGNPYKLIGQDTAGKVAIDLGVYGAPETFVLDKQGMIRYRHVGVLNQEIWLHTIAPLMKKLEQAA